MKREILTLGAESQIFKVSRWNHEYVLKVRPKKPYLHFQIDANLRNIRTNRECKMLTIARSLGVPTPAVYSVDIHNHSILMDFIDGVQLKEIVDEIDKSKLQKMSAEFGRLIALLHRGNMVHGDPTTSNILVDKNEKLWMIDFGLAELNATVEMRGVDLHLIRRALETTHWELEDIMLKAVIKGYTKILGSDAEVILTRMEDIRERGRYH